MPIPRVRRGSELLPLFDTFCFSRLTSCVLMTLRAGLLMTGTPSKAVVPVERIWPCHRPNHEWPIFSDSQVGLLDERRTGGPTRSGSLRRCELLACRVL